MKKADAVAVIGAGLSGLSCAQALQSAGKNVHVYESSGDIGGRCATQLWQGHLVDTGVQYFTAQSAEFKKEMLMRLRQFRPIVSPIFDGSGQAIPNSCGPRFYVLQGNSYFAHVLSQGLKLKLKTPVQDVTFEQGTAKILGEDYGAVVSALPGPLTAQIFELAETPAEYHPCLVALLEYAGINPGQTRDCYGRIFADRGGALQASYCENNKVGRIVGSKTVFVVEAAPRYSREHAGEPPEKFLPELVREHEDAWAIPTGQLMAGSGHWWRYARPVPGSQTAPRLPTGAFYCGDARTESTVENVWLDGQKAAQEVLRYLEQASG